MAPTPAEGEIWIQINFTLPKRINFVSHLIYGRRMRNIYTNIKNKMSAEQVNKLTKMEYEQLRVFFIVVFLAVHTLLPSVLECLHLIGQNFNTRYDVISRFFFSAHEFFGQPSYNLTVLICKGFSRVISLMCIRLFLIINQIFLRIFV